MRTRRCGSCVLALVLALLPARGPLAALQQQNQSGNTGPVPIQMGLRLTAAASGPIVAWQAVPDATRYVVHRWKRRGSQSRCCEVRVPVGTAIRWVDAASLEPATYVYRVVAHLSGNRRRYQERVLQVAGQGTAAAQAPATDDPPPSTTATLDPGNRPDVLYRQPPAGTATALPPTAPVSGTAPAADPPLMSASPSSPEQPAAQPTAPTGGQPVGMPGRNGPIEVPLQPVPASGGSGTGEPPAAAGRYLVTAVAMYAGSVTTDNLLHEDGKGDEVFAAAFVRRYDRRTAAVLESSTRQTTVYGDVLRRVTERTQAGRLSPTGGIGNGDPVPGDAPAVRMFPAQERVFPWKLWEGTLTDGMDAVVISPSVWEYDGRPALFDMWMSNQNALTGTLFFSQRLNEQITWRGFSPIALGATEASEPRWLTEARVNAPAIIAMALGFPPVFNLEGQDRPIGMVAGPSLPNTTVVLTREIIEAALAQPPMGALAPMQGVVIPLPKPGMMVVNFEDRWRPSLTDRVAFYSMVLQVERMP